MDPEFHAVIERHKKRTHEYFRVHHDISQVSQDITYLLKQIRTLQNFIDENIVNEEEG